MPDLMERSRSITPCASHETRHKDGQSNCSLCGLPVGRSGVKHTFNEEVLPFCCTGCLHVFQILFYSPEGPPANFRETELYRACLESGLIAGGEEYQRQGHALEIDPGDKTVALLTSLDDEIPAQELALRVEGMWCTACSWLVEQTLRKTRGIKEADVSFLSDMAVIKYLPHRVNLEDIRGSISKLGYRVSRFEDVSKEASEKRGLLLRLGISAILTVNVMMISFALYGGFFQELGQEGIRYFSYPLWILSTPVIFYGGLPILKRACFGLRFGSTSMDTLIAVGSLSAYSYSVIGIYYGSLHLYFDTATMLVTLVLLGKFIESQAREKVSRSITELYRLVGGKVRLLWEGRERWASPEALSPGDEFVVKAQERCPADGRIISGAAAADISFLTGETRPLKKSVGDEVLGGTLILEGELKLKTTRVGTESSLNQVISLMQEALSRKNPVELLADRITRWLVPLVLILSSSTALYLLFHDAPADEALLRALAVLVITCPCALGIATPLAKVATIGIGRTEGILIRDHGALEKVKDLDVIVFDKTGTLTEGNFLLREVFAAGISADEALRQVAAVEIHSEHFIAKEIVRKAHQKSLELPEVKSFQSLEGLGVKGVIAGAEIVVGNRELMKLIGLEISPEIEGRAGMCELKGLTVVFFAFDGAVRGFLAMGDVIRKDALELVGKLHARGLSIRLVSGDSKETTRAVAQELNISEFVGRSLPQDKVEIIKALQGEGLRVGMVGDGMNDAAALARADVGFALGSGINILQEASDITFLSGDPKKILEVFRLSELAGKVIRQNLLFAFIYNILGIPLAIAGVLNPLMAVIAMFASSITVTGNTLRISKLEVREH